MCIWHGKWPPWCLYSLFLHFLATGVSLCMWLKVENWYHHPHQQPGQQRQPVQDWYQWKLYRWHRSKDASKGPHDQHQAKVIFHTWWFFVKLNMFLDHYSCQAVRIYTWVNLNDGVKIIFDWNHFPGSTKPEPTNKNIFGKIAVTVISYEGLLCFLTEHWFGTETMWLLEDLWMWPMPWKGESTPQTNRLLSMAYIC